MLNGRRARVASLTALAIGILATAGGCAAHPMPTAAAPSLPAAEPPASATTSPVSPSHAATRVVTVGDSVMSGYGLARSGAWPALLAVRAHVDVTNLACPGMGFVVAGACGTSYDGLVPAVAALQPEVLLVESSSNDFWEDPEEIRDDTDSTIALLHDAAPDALIVGLSTIWNDDAEVPDDTALTSDALRDAVGAVGGTFLDVGQPLQGHPEWMQDDDVHPTERGQRAIEQTIQSRLGDVDLLP